ncbi:hypothetical protein B0H11DRAFT_2258566 [Mycena galericulata]|nr:hypothetical protein B0H11DRAFT_2258566 [Mycena galericulata]
MPRTTRSGAEFSPYTLNGFEYDPGPPTVIETGISLGPYLEAALAAADRRADRQEEENSEVDEWEDEEWEDDLEVASRPPSPTSDASSSPAFSHPSTPQPSPSTLVAASPSPPSDTVDKDAEMPMPILLPGGDVEHNRRRDAARAHRERKRRDQAPRTPYDKGLDTRFDQSYRTLAPEHVSLSASRLAHSKTGWIGLRCTKKKGKGVKGRRVRKLWTVEELKALGYRRIKWDGKHPMVIVDRDGRIVAVFVGKPDDRKWDTEVIQGACRAMDRASRKGLETGALTAKDRDHRRGAFLSLTTGVSFGGGQKV